MKLSEEKTDSELFEDISFLVKDYLARKGEYPEMIIMSGGLYRKLCKDDEFFIGKGTMFGIRTGIFLCNELEVFLSEETRGFNALA